MQGDREFLRERGATPPLEPDGQGQTRQKLTPVQRALRNRGKLRRHREERRERQRVYQWETLGCSPESLLMAAAMLVVTWCWVAYVAQAAADGDLFLAGAARATPAVEVRSSN
ncbi:hypothetical protein DIPPA_11202 [Diplonema papillatum]|nr:hypothetical protein DIPPA_11202 [Diplonema papillatum]